MFENIGMEETILQSLFYDSEYYSKVYSSLKGSHFSNTIIRFLLKYKALFLLMKIDHQLEK